MRTFALTRHFAAAALLGTLLGCATPQYQTHVRLIPPADAQGRDCVQACEAQKNICQTRCQTRYQACVKDLEPQLEARYAEALSQYGNELRRYATALRHYEMQLRFEWLNSYPYHHPYGWYPWPVPYLPPPYPEPVMPTREGVRAQLEKSNCQSDCNCLPAYDTCFIGCGGQRLTETVCIRNCPAEK
jgi:hypothetical protein